MRLLDDLGDGGVLDVSALVAYRLLDRASRRRFIQRSDFWKIEESFCVGFRFACLPSQLRKACSHHRDRNLALCAPMKGSDEHGQLLLGNVLELVHEEYDGGSGF